MSQEITINVLTGYSGFGEPTNQEIYGRCVKVYENMAKEELGAVVTELPDGQQALR